jgi:hypothetical protein
VGRYHHRRDARLAATVAVALFATYVAVQRGRVVSYDGSIMVNLAVRLLTKHTFTIDPAADTLHLQGRYTYYGFGTTLLHLPFEALQRAVAPRGASILTLANPLVLAGCGSLLFLIGRRLGWRRSVCVVTALGFGLLTTAVWQSTEIFSEPGVTLASLLIAFGALKWSERTATGSLLVGVGLGVAILFRADSLLLVAPLAVMVPFVVPRDRLLSRPTILAMAGPIAAVGAFELWYNNLRFGSILDFGVSHYGRGRDFSTPILEGLDMLLRSPSRGFFWTSPILIIALPGFVLLFRRNRPLTVAIGVVVVARFLFFAHWFIPGGGVAWGPRLVFPVTALLAIPAGAVVEDVCRWHSARRRHLAWTGLSVLAAASAAVAFLSIVVGYEQYWNQWMRVPQAQQRQRSHAYFWSLSHSAIAGNLHLLRTGFAAAPIHFRHGPDPVGIIAIAIAGLATIAALVGARQDPSEPGPEIERVRSATALPVGGHDGARDTAGVRAP